MMSTDKQKYASPSDWLAALRQDEAWQSQLRQLQASDTNSISIHRDNAIRRIGNGPTFEFWDIHQHNVELAVTEVWEIAELSLPKLKIQAIGMLSMEWIEQQMTPAEMVKRAAKKKTPANVTQKRRELMTFKRKGQVTDGHLTLLFMMLQKAEWIEGNEADFKALFSEKMDEDCVITWKKTFGKSTLVELFKQLVNAGLVIVPDGFTIPAILEGHFKDEEGEWLTGLSKGDKPNNKALPMITKCIKMLKADTHTLLNVGLDDDDGYDSGYDPFDHQDLQYHTR